MKDISGVLVGVMVAIFVCMVGGEILQPYRVVPPPEFPLAPSAGTHYARVYKEVIGGRSPFVVDLPLRTCYPFRVNPCEVFLLNMEMLNLGDSTRKLVRTLRFLHEEEVAGRARY